MTQQRFGRWNPHRPSCGCKEKMADCESSLGLSMLVGKRAFVKYSRNRIRLFGDVYDEEYELDYNVTKSCRGISYFYLKKEGLCYLVGNGKEIYADTGLVNGGSVADSGPYEGETERLGAIRRFITVHQPHDPSARIEMFYCDDYSTPKGIYLASQDRATGGDLYSVGYMNVVNPYASHCKVLYKDVGTQTLTGSGNGPHACICNGGNALVPESGRYSALYWKNETSTHRWESPYLVCGTHYAQIGAQAFYEGGDIATVKTDHRQTSANRIVTQNESAAIMSPDGTVGLYRYGYKVQTYPTFGSTLGGRGKSSGVRFHGVLRRQTNRAARLHQ